MLSNNLQRELYASVISTKPSQFLKNLEKLEKVGINGIHFDVMDGSFVPRLGLFPEFLEDIRAISSLPIEVHMMVDNPEPYIEDFVEAGATSIIAHIESVKHISRIITKIKNLGAQAGVALNPGTQISSLQEIVKQLDTVVLMAINPGIVGHPFIQETFNKINRLKKLLTELNASPTIEIDGGITFDNAHSIVTVAERRPIRLICGAGTIFHKDDNLEQNAAKLLSSLSG